MKPCLSFLTIFYLLATSLFAQELKLAVSPIPKFQSDPEKEAFEKLIERDFESEFKLLYFLKAYENSDQESKHAHSVRAFVEKIRPKVDKAKKPEKKIKIIHKAVHQEFLKKYVLQNAFQDIFIRGEYNCVSATALYALVLQELRIPFSIQETPAHVFLVAYPETVLVALESTDPQIGYVVYDAKFKQQYINQLRKMKVISEQEYQSKGIEALFEEMYFDNQDISLPELIGLQYYNDGLYLMEQEAYDKSLSQFEKAYSLYPSERIAFLIYNNLLLLVDEKPFTDSSYVDYLAKLANIQGLDNKQEMVKGTFARFTQDQLSKKTQHNYYDTMYNKLIGQIQDSVLQLELSHFYFYEKARTAYNSGRYTDGLLHIEKAFILHPENLDNRNLFAGCLNQRLNTLYTLDEKTELLESYLEKYPLLEENNILYSQLLQLYLIGFGQAYELDQKKKGRQYRGFFEKAYSQKKVERKLISLIHL